jgi:hypothetical protein
MNIIGSFFLFIFEAVFIFFGVLLTVLWVLLDFMSSYKEQ